MQKKAKCARSIFIQGRAGSGKSTLIHEIKRRIINKFGENSVVLVVPTGVAAFNINGTTIHSAFSIAINNHPYIPLEGVALNKFRNRLEKVLFIIVDEHSMISAHLMGIMEHRLHEIHSESPDVNWAGMFMYFLGDIRQLVPVACNAHVYGSER